MTSSIATDTEVFSIPPPSKGFRGTITLSKVGLNIAWGWDENGCPDWSEGSTIDSPPTPPPNNNPPPPPNNNPPPPPNTNVLPVKDNVQPGDNTGSSDGADITPVAGESGEDDIDKDLAGGGKTTWNVALIVGITIAVLAVSFGAACFVVKRKQRNGRQDHPTYNDVRQRRIATQNNRSYNLGTTLSRRHFVNLIGL